MLPLAIPRARAVQWFVPLAWLRAVVVGLTACLDGLTVALVLGYVALTAVGAPANYLGIPDAVAVALVGVVVAGAGLAGASLAVAARWLIGQVTSVLRRRPLVVRHARLGAVIGLPARFLTAVPLAWLGAFGVLLWIAVAGRTTFAPLAILTPPGPTAPYLYLVGLTGAILGLARAIGHTRRDGRLPGLRSRLAGTLLVGLAGVVLVASASMAWWPGDGTSIASADPAYDGPLPPTTLEDPGMPGPFEVERLSYGSGEDLTTRSVDASALLPPLPPGAAEAREWFWGFDTARLPVQGLAWLPVGDGPFPLVLIAHGNHAMGQSSADGYAYLGEHLASRGFVVASISEDFLNGAWGDDYHGEEQLVRAWLLLVHLDTWRSWSMPGGPLAGRIDLDRVALIGHSRGGEAASVAASLAGDIRPPRTGMTPWPSGLDVDAVVSIAPSDGQYTGALRLEGVDFLTLQGGWDADARAWSGIRQYARTRPDPDGFAAAMWAYRANHGQWNTVWGATDFGPFSPAVLDLAPLLSGEEQRDVARTAIGAFLEASLHGEDAYRGLFRRPMVGREWLPDDIVIVRSRSGSAIELTPAGPDRPLEGTSVMSAGGTAQTRTIPLRALQANQARTATLLTWGAGEGVASWAIEGLDRVAAEHGPSSGIRLALADGRSAGDEHAGSLAVTVRAVAGAVAVRLPIERFGALPPPLPVRLAKHDVLAALSGLDLSVRSPSEVVLQTYEIPLAAFAALDPGFDPAALSEVAVEVDRSGDGAIWIAEPALVP